MRVTKIVFVDNLCVTIPKGCMKCAIMIALKYDPQCGVSRITINENDTSTSMAKHSIMNN